MPSPAPIRSRHRRARRISRRPLFGLSAGLAALALVAAAPTANARTVDLRSGEESDVRADGEQANDLTGSAAAGGCDVDDDGRGDQIVGGFGADPQGRASAGAAYVILGSAGQGTVDLGNLGRDGFRITGAAGDSLGFSLDCAGDTNDDGTDDVIVGAFGADPNGDTSGSSYVVYGKKNTDEVDLTHLGDQGFRIDGVAAGDRAGAAVAGGGDVNDDGRDDVVIGANAADPGGSSSAGSSYVVFSPGERDVEEDGSVDPIQLGSLGGGGYRIDGDLVEDRSGFSVGGAGDVNGDGTPDALVGAYTADPNGRQTAGAAYVIFGKDDGDTVDLGDLGGDGFRVDGASTLDRAGISVANAGDVDGDDRDDVLVGADQSPNATAGGYAQLIYGKAGNETVDLADPDAEEGYRIMGALPGDLTGYSVRSAGDVNEDGRPDQIVGAYGADPEARNGAGSAYVVYGRRRPDDEDLPLPTPGIVPLAGIETEARESEGFRIDGAEAGDRTGRAVAGAGDANSDGAGDVWVGADFATPDESVRSGAAYRVLSPNAPETPPSPGDPTDTGDNGASRDGGNGNSNGKGNGKGNGNDDSSDAPALPALTEFGATTIGRPECAPFTANFRTAAQLDRCSSAAGRGLLEPAAAPLTICREAGFRGTKRSRQRVSDLTACQTAVVRARARLGKPLGLPPTTG